jgi:hypothetical protein
MVGGLERRPRGINAFNAAARTEVGFQGLFDHNVVKKAITFDAVLGDLKRGNARRTVLRNGFTT